ncbi:MAG: sporulation protein YunB [Lachnospirales bacterium]
MGRKKRKLKIKSRKRKIIKKVFVIYLIILSVTIFATSKIIDAFEEKIQPLVFELARVYSLNLLNNLIADIIEEEVVSKNYTSENFYSYEIDNEGYITVFEINNLLINDITTKISNSLQEKLIDTTETVITVPIGEILFVEYFSNVGPSYKYGLIPIGYGNVDYDTEFNSIGINQSNFKVYLRVNAGMKIVNPLYEKEFTISKEVVLLDTMISGKVPNGVLLQ